MEKRPKISIISSVYNVGKYLPECVRSVIAQTFKDWELILIDDGSTDNSGKICDSFASEDDRIRVVHKANSGLADSRNLGVSIAEAPLIGFVDSDDWIEPDMFEILYDTMVQNDADISICGFFKSYKNREKRCCCKDRTIVMSMEEALSKILDDKEIKSFVWNKLYKKEVLTELMPKSMYYEDYATAFKWFANTKKVAMRTVPLYHYRQRQGSIDHDIDPIKKYHFFLAEVERYNYLVSRNLLPEKHRNFEVNIVKCGVQEAKEIARKAGKSHTAFQYIKKIRSEYQQFLPVNLWELGLKKYCRLMMLQNSISFYVRMMRIGRHVADNRMFNKKVNFQ